MCWLIVLISPTVVMIRNPIRHSVDLAADMRLISSFKRLNTLPFHLVDSGNHIVPRRLMVHRYSQPSLRNVVYHGCVIAPEFLQKPCFPHKTCYFLAYRGWFNPKGSYGCFSLHVSFLKRLNLGYSDRTYALSASCDRTHTGYFSTNFRLYRKARSHPRPEVFYKCTF